MSFIDALKTGRPMRRPWSTGQAPWLYLGTEKIGVGHDVPAWRNIETGARVGLHRWDYEATDWEVQP